MIFKKLIYIQYLLLFVVCFTVVTSCKSIEKGSIESSFLSCQNNMRDENWDQAITLCAPLQIVQAKAYVAEAYMAKSKIDFKTMMEKLTVQNSLTITDLFTELATVNKHEETLKLALRYLFDPLVLTFLEKTKNTPQAEGFQSSMVIEASLVSSLLIFNALNNIAKIKVDKNGALSFCDNKPCSFFPAFQYADPKNKTSPTGMGFNGIPETFYDAICGNNNSFVYNQKDKVFLKSFNFHSSIRACRIVTNSVLYYNKIAFKYLSDELKDHFPLLAKLNFANDLDSGENVSLKEVFTDELSKMSGISTINIAMLQSVSFDLCDPKQVALKAKDHVITDCEFLKYFLHFKL